MATAMSAPMTALRVGVASPSFHIAADHVPHGFIPRGNSLVDLVQVFGQVVIRVGVMIIVVIVVIVFVVIIRVVNDATIAGIGVRRQFVVVMIFVLFMQFRTAGCRRTFPFATSSAASTTAATLAPRLVIGAFGTLRRVEVVHVVVGFHVLKAVGLL
jgi:hypothetical protein